MSWMCLGASVAGVRHRRADQPCQDVHGSRNLDDQTVVAVVSDGAGSAEFGLQGANIAVQCTLETIPRLLEQDLPQTLPCWTDVMKQVVCRAQEAVQRKADAKGHSKRNYAATLLAVVARPDQIVCASIGDCAAVIQNGRGELRSLCPPQRGEYSNSTRFYCLPGAENEMDVRLYDWGCNRNRPPNRSLAQVALLTDGLLELALNVPTNRPFAPFFQPLFTFAREVPEDNCTRAVADLTRFLESDRVNARTHDDKTLLLLTHRR